MASAAVGAAVVASLGLVINAGNPGAPRLGVLFSIDGNNLRISVSSGIGYNRYLTCESGGMADTTDLKSVGP